MNNINFMIITTTNTIEGKKIIEYKQIITSHVIIGANVFRDFMASVRDIVGGRSKSYEMKLEDAKRIALDELEKEGVKVGANAIVGVDFDFETVGANGSMLMVSASGTAVTIE